LLPGLVPPAALDRANALYQMAWGILMVAAPVFITRIAGGGAAGQIIRVMPRRAPPRPSPYGLRSSRRPPRHRSLSGAWACAW